MYSRHVVLVFCFLILLATFKSPIIYSINLNLRNMISVLRKKISGTRRVEKPGSSVPNVDAPSSRDATTNPTPGTSPSTSFSYAPLQNLTQNFRLVIVDPATDSSSKIFCQVLNTSLDSAGEYEALSYRWSEEQAETPILLRHASSTNNESPTCPEAKMFGFRITQNLEAALRALRLPDKPRTLWIDSICIDQNNLTERNVQVTLMGQIYHQCTRDLLWLGTETVKIQRAMNLIQKLVNNETQFSKFQENDWSDIEAMIGANPVWNRVWIVQELYFAPKILLCCHGQSLNWDVILEMIEDNEEFKHVWISQDQSKMFQEVHRSFRNITMFQTIRHKESRAKRLFAKSLFSMVLTFGGYGATKPVDKIYGLLNIADDADGFPVGYEKSLNEVSIDFAYHVVTRNKSLLMLSAALGDPLAYLNTKETIEDAPTQALPSWIMDISKSIPSVSGLTLCGQSPYNACGMMAEAFVKISEDRRCLFAGGWRIDSIGQLNTVSPLMDGETPRERWIRDIYRWEPENSMERLYVPTNETFLNAYLRTIVADRNLDKRISSEDIEGPTWYERYCSLQERTVPEEPVMLPGWRFGIGKSGILCMLPPAAEEGDLMVVLFGAKLPYLLRPLEQGGDAYRLVGEAYLHGYMDGQILLQVAKSFQEGDRVAPAVFSIL